MIALTFSSNSIIEEVYISTITFCVFSALQKALARVFFLLIYFVFILAYAYLRI